MRPWIVGSNPGEPVGSSVSDGYSGRVMDASSGAGLFNPNTDPAVVGIDPLTGLDAASGTDMSFGAAIRRQMQTNVINGDFSVLPPGGAGSLIVSDPADAGYNPLPGWTWTPDAAGLWTARMVATAPAPSGYTLYLSTATAGTSGVLSQLVPVPMSTGQQYRVMLSAYGYSSFSDTLAYVFLASDGVSVIGSPVSSTWAGGNLELKVDAGLVPSNAAYIKVSITPSTSIGNHIFGEVRAAFLPAEATVGLGSLAPSTGAITTTEKQVKGITIPANTLVVGSVYAIEAWATVTSSAANNVTLRIRLGTTTLTGTILDNINPTATTTASADPFMLRGIVTVYTVGATGTVQVGLSIVGSNTQPFSVPVRTDMPSAAITIDTTVANILELTAQTGAGTTSVNFRHAIISCLMAS